MCSSEWICYFAFVVHTSFALSIKASLSQPTGFLTFIFPILSLIPQGDVSKQLCGAELPTGLNPQHSPLLYHWHSSIYFCSTMRNREGCGLWIWHIGVVTAQEATEHDRMSLECWVSRVAAEEGEKSLRHIGIWHQRVLSTCKFVRGGPFEFYVEKATKL